MSPGPSQSIDSGVGPTRRRSLIDGNAGPLSKPSTIPNKDSVISTEDVDPCGLSNSAQLFITNGLGKRGLKKRRLNDDHEDFKGKGRPDATKLKSLRKRKVPLIVTLDSSEESSSEEENPIR